MWQLTQQSVPLMTDTNRETVYDQLSVTLQSRLPSAQPVCRCKLVSVGPLRLHTASSPCPPVLMRTRRGPAEEIFTIHHSPCVLFPPSCLRVWSLLTASFTNFSRTPCSLSLISYTYSSTLFFASFLSFSSLSCMIILPWKSRSGGVTDTHTDWRRDIKPREDEDNQTDIWWIFHTR